MPSKIKILKGITVSLVTTAIIVGTTEVALRMNGYVETAAMYYDSDVGMRYFPNQSRRMIRDGEDIGEVSTNEWGFRTPSFEIEKDPDKFRIACLGDSFTLGWGVPDNKTWPRVLQDMCDRQYGIGRVEVLNLGQPDFNTVNELRLYRSFVSSLDSDLVILGFVENDLAPETLGPVSKVAVLDQWIGNSAIMRAFRVHYFNRLGVYQYAHNPLNKKRRAKYNANRTTITERPMNPIGKDYWTVSMTALGDLAAAVQADETPMMLLLFPLRFQVPLLADPNEGQEIPSLETTPAYQRRIGFAAKTLGIPMVDLRAEYVRVGSKIYADIDNFHPGPIGMRIAAKEIGKLLDESKMISKN